MSYSHRIHAKILDLSGQPSHPPHPQTLRRSANGHLFDPSTSTKLQPKIQIEATIRHLNGDPIHRDRPYPALCRTTSGHLFQPELSPIHERELRRSVMSTGTDTDSLTGPELRSRRRLPAAPAQKLKMRQDAGQFGAQPILRTVPRGQGQLVETGWEHRQNASFDELRKHNIPVLVSVSPYELRNVSRNRNLRGLASRHSLSHGGCASIVSKEPSMVVDADMPRPELRTLPLSGVCIEDSPLRMISIMKVEEVDLVITSKRPLSEDVWMQISRDLSAQNPLTPCLHHAAV
ncbi:hypothetical protein BDW02DRAFT_201126 [Decorospora gaudefroyi]|uniref:Uncharacterized protein n=1 Tax=Decorospora gaudefroyi TaxID=184978 RepID=A0A6A5KT52_9PLEO|nr:hypothetical protein BDW02DRAFT_201126 [Decorospora gaudefroyi]